MRGRGDATGGHFLRRMERDGEQDGRDQRDWLRGPAMTAKVTREQLRDAARLYLRKESMMQFTLLPENLPPKPVPEE